MEEARAGTLASARGATQAYRCSIFLGAFLLFAVQLVLGKYFLPWFGGSAALWTTCMFLFQLLLLAGYAYAHALVNWFEPRVQSLVHSAFLVFALLLLTFLALRWHSPLTPPISWRSPSSDHPIRSIVALLCLSAGLPYFVLSATGPLLQSWFTRTHPGCKPYRLYALSNLGSLLALFSYPFLVEPWLSLRMQARLWFLGFLAYAVVCGLCAQHAGRSKKTQNLRLHSADTEAAHAYPLGTEKPSTGSYILWLSLAACASVMFLATTNQICQDVSVVPFLWVLPLGLYLLSFIICFDAAKWYSRAVFHSAFAVGVFFACFVLVGWAIQRILVVVAVYLFTLFAGCMICHGELARSKPNARYLTSFYLMIALGGALGGVLVALIVPHLFPTFWEYQLGLWSVLLLLFLTLARDKSSWLYCSRWGLPAIAVLAALLPGCVSLAHGARSLGMLFPILPLLIAVYLVARRGQEGFDRTRSRAAPFYCVTALLILGAVLFVGARAQVGSSMLLSRNFYGVLAVKEISPNHPDRRALSLFHGRIMHGLQFTSEAKRNLPTSYYGASSGVGRALAALQTQSQRSAHQQKIRIGVVGLGIGTLAAYGRPGDYVRFYEINPEVTRIARDDRYFTYLKNSVAKLDVVAGDARLSMESELNRDQAQHFDLLAIDAFSGDAIPIHLLTEEAFQIYLKEIQPEGIIAVHTTNTYFDLRPPLLRIAQHFGLKFADLYTVGDGNVTTYSDWVLLSRDAKFIDSVSTPQGANQAVNSATSLWTDDYSNLFRALRR
jgi:hypothetical protein